MNLVNLHDLKPSFIEAGVVVDKGDKPMVWHHPDGANGGHLPDEQRVFPADRPLSGARELWQFFDKNYKSIRGFAHSHPGDMYEPSWTDITTFAVLESELCTRYDWWIVTRHRVSLVRWKGPGIHDYSVELLETEPAWAGELRARSRRTQTTA
jgi:hypothetical protein